MDREKEFPYVGDILRQPKALRTFADTIPTLRSGWRERLSLDGFDRVVLTGMGTSLFGMYPARLALVDAGVRAWWEETAELVHYADSLITSSTILWVTSQSGRSAEVLALLERVERARPGLVIAMTNDDSSPLALAADEVISLQAGSESTVATCTYVNTLAASHTLAAWLVGRDLPQTVWETAADEVERYLDSWSARTAALSATIPDGASLVVLGRGPSVASAWTGALVLKEASKVSAEGLTAAAFRHGPLELADERLAAIMLQGPAQTAALNRRLGGELVGLGTCVIWLGDHCPPGAFLADLPPVGVEALPIVEAVPLQLASVALAVRQGLEPGAFRNQGKVTVVE